MNSILQSDTTKCFICEQNPGMDPLDKHHIYGGPMRSLSERYGLFVFIHHNKCHIFGKNSAHKNNAVRKKLQALGQAEAMKRYGWTREEFTEKFMRNYLEDEP